MSVRAAFFGWLLGAPNQWSPFAMAAAPEIQPALYNINEIAQLLSCSRRTIYELITRGDLEAVKLLYSTKITAKSFHALIARAPKAKIVLPSRAARNAKARKARAQAEAR
jgi:excisionase family DNA binding protein